jgi:hypothetical protein
MPDKSKGEVRRYKAALSTDGTPCLGHGGGLFAVAAGERHSGDILNDSGPI